MRTLVGAGEPEQHHAPTLSFGVSNTGNATATGVLWWRPAKPGDTPGQMDPEVREPYRTTAWVERPREIEFAEPR